MTDAEMMGVLSPKLTCDDPPGLSFDPANPTEVDPGNQVTLNVIGGIPPYTFELLEVPLFFLDASYIAWPPGYSDTYIKASSDLGVDHRPWFALDPSIVRTGTYTGTTWLSGAGQTTTERLNIDLGSAKTIKQIMLENCHSTGGELDTGIKNFVLQGSNDPNALAQTDYASDTYWTTIQAGLQAAEHSAVNFFDPQLLDIDNDTAYRYLSLKIADNWGDGYDMGLRHVQFHTSQVKVFKTVTAAPQITITAPSYALITTRVKCTDVCSQTAETFIYCTAGRWALATSTGGGGSPVACGNAHFRIIKNGVMFVGDVCNSNSVGLGGDQGWDCSGAGGGDESVNINEACGGLPGCDNVQDFWIYCWPYP